MKPKSVLFRCAGIRTQPLQSHAQPLYACPFPPLLLHSPMTKRKSGILTKRSVDRAVRPRQSPPARWGFYPQGLGTKEGVVIEILASRTKNQLREIMKAYEEGKGPAKGKGAGPELKAHLGMASNFGSLAGDKGQAEY